MPSGGYGAQALALPVDSRPVPERRSSSPFGARPSSFRRPTISTRSSGVSSQHAGTWWTRTQKNAQTLSRRGWRTYSALTALQRAGLIALVGFSVVFAILFFVYNRALFDWLAGFARKWRHIPAGWLILWCLTFLASFPPMIGYSSLLSMAGVVYGFPGGWPIVASATVVGSTVSFICCRYLFRDYVARLVAKDTRFAALSLTIKHDGLKLLVLIRLCPLPYSLSNGAISTIPTVNWFQFALATAAITPKLLIHVFIGAKFGQIAEHGGEMDFKTKALSYLSIALGAIAGVVTGAIIYRQTTKRARELEAEEQENAVPPSADSMRSEYSDDPAALEAAANLREQDDDISLRSGDEWFDNDELDEDAVEHNPYRDHSPNAGRTERKNEGKD